jgi:hypothetical protein
VGTVIDFAAMAFMFNGEVIRTVVGPIYRSRPESTYRTAKNPRATL